MAVADQAVPGPGAVLSGNKLARGQSARQLKNPCVAQHDFGAVERHEGNQGAPGHGTMGHVLAQS